MKAHLIMPPGGVPEEYQDCIYQRDVPGHPGWRTNQLGWIMSSSDRWGTGKWRYRSVQQDSEDPKGWRIFMGRREGESKSWKYVREMVLLAFGPEKPSEWHKAWPIDGDTGNHCFWNLEWVDYKVMVHGIEARKAWVEAGREALLRKHEESRKREAEASPFRMTISEDDLKIAAVELEGGRSLRAIWEERFLHKCDILKLQQLLERFRT